MSSPRSLYVQLSLAITAIVVTSVLVVAAGTYIAFLWGDESFLAALSPEARWAYMREWGDYLPPEPILREIMIAEETLSPQLDDRALIVGALLSVVVIVVGASISVAIARRLTKPLERAAASAKIMATGNFSHRMPASSMTSREVDSLARSINHLAQSLQGMEQNIHFNSAAFAHEITTPLTIIHGYLQGIRDGVFEPSEELVDLILGHLEGLNHLISDLKTLSLANSGQLRLNAVPVRLSDHMEDVVRLFAESHDQPISFEYVGDPDLEKHIPADADRIEQVVLGLIQNSIRHGGAGVSIRTQYEQDDNSVRIRVEDNGPGFSREAMDNARRSFWRGDSARSQETDGSGLGLSVANAIVAAHGGRLELGNRRDGGAVVDVYLPIDQTGR